MASNIDQFDVSAEGLGRYTIDVALPTGHERGDTKYPVILVTDANILFDMVQVVAHGRFQEGNLLPPAILVGVGYPADEGLASWYGRRNHDFHDAWDMTDPLGKLLHTYFDMMKAADRKPDLVMNAGGYPRFMAFLRDELLPLLAKRYPIDTTARHTLVGHSSGGHFTLRALVDPASPFRRYVAISPSIGTAPGTIQRAEAEYAASQTDLDADVFVCCGAVEVDGDPGAAMCQFSTGVMWTAGQFAIRQWPSARLQWEVMNNEDHSSIPLRAIAAGLRSVHRLRPGVHVEEIRRSQAARVEALLRRS
jgi:predicted alpha/beta superfamily hydrolase